MIALDTNVFAYAAFEAADLRKARAVDIVGRAAIVSVVLPVQVLVEFGNASLKRRQLSASAAAARIAEWSRVFPVVRTQPEHVLRALALVMSDQLAYFDALIIAVAADASATTLLSEDMQDGASHAGVRVVNPFKPANHDLVERLLTPSP